MRCWPFMLFILAILPGCDVDIDEQIIISDDPIGTSHNRWTSQRLWPVLDAQERRDAEGLCMLIKAGEPEVRRAAALAFASVQDTAGIPCLLEALDDRMAMVRASAAFALGFIGDGPAVERMDEAFGSERDTTVLHVYNSARSIALLRLGKISADDLIEMLQHGPVHDRVRAADALRRLPDTVISQLRPDLDRLFRDQDHEVRQFLILAMGKMGEDAVRSELQRIAIEGRPGERVNAIRALGNTANNADLPFFFNALRDPVTNVLALEQLERFELNGNKCLEKADSLPDRRTRIVMLGLALEHGDESVAAEARTRLEGMDGPGISTYEKAEIIRALYRRPGENAGEELLVIITSDRPAPERQAAFQAALLVVRDRMSRSRYTDREAQYQQLKELIHETMKTGDAGLVCAAVEVLLEEEPTVLMILYPLELARQTMERLEPLRDLEARLLLEKLQAKRYGIPPPAHQPPAYNHAIDKRKLTVLKHGQQYRISTSKGDIIVATSVNEAPGSALAFDSLVAAGYYDGKSFHRVVPNFVVQGGCQRGDGYGGMPWTLRTEIGMTPFTAGSLGLASAGRDTESSQFFITHGAAPHLDGRYTRFGEVVSGMDVLWKLQVGDVMKKVERLESLAN